ncbi:hypothetical protein LIER_00897 [Lithospermum erythrorhizon]|uniref:Uncharacterized protein n=1 Tax=Lithospermum erythrorhizon TaxID=34254 RepID=A0AAV3NKI1_LITER
MMKTRGSVNTYGKATKGKKKLEESSNDACSVVEPQLMEEKAKKVKGLKKAKVKRGKGEGSKAPASTKRRRVEEPVFNSTPIRYIPEPNEAHSETP